MRRLDKRYFGMFYIPNAMYDRFATIEAEYRAALPCIRVLSEPLYLPASVRAMESTSVDGDARPEQTIDHAPRVGDRVCVFENVRLWQALLELVMRRDLLSGVCRCRTS